MGRRQIISTITMLVLIGILVLGAVWGWKSLFAEIPDDVVAEPTPTCSPERIKAGGKLRSRQVAVSVFNGGTRSGLASQTLDALMNRGFLSGETGNAPDDIGVRRAQVRTTARRDPAAQLVAQQFGPGTRVVVTDDDLGPGIDVIVGDGFRALAKAPRAVTVRRAHEVCVPVEPAEPLG